MRRQASRQKAKRCSFRAMSEGGCQELRTEAAASDPLTCSPDCFTTIAPISYSSGSFSGTIPGTAVVFFNALSGGGLDINFTLGGNSYLFEFFGALPYFNGSTSNPTLLTGSFFYGGLSFGFNGSLGDIVNTNGTITATSPTTVPEPSSLIFLGTGAVAIAGAMRRKLLSGIRS